MFKVLVIYPRGPPGAEDDIIVERGRGLLQTLQRAAATLRHG